MVSAKDRNTENGSVTCGLQRDDNGHCDGEVSAFGTVEMCFADAASRLKQIPMTPPSLFVTLMCDTGDEVFQYLRS